MLKKKLIQIAGLAAMFIAQSPLSMAGNVPSPPDINFENTPPPMYSECSKEIYTLKGAFNTPAEQRIIDAACSYAVDEASRMAERWGGGNGKIQGGLYGFAYGLNKMATATENDADGANAARAFVASIGDQMASGYSAGVATAAAQAAGQGKSDAIAQFQKALNQGTEPNPAVVVPPITYQGEDNGFDTMKAQLGLVVRDPRGIIQNDIHDYTAYQRIYTSSTDVYLGTVTQLNIWDLWFGDGKYVFEKATWYDQNKAFKYWVDSANITKPTFEDLASKQVVKSKDATTGAITYFDLQNEVFKAAFTNSYGYYINYYFSHNFAVAMDDGENAGELIGKQVGRQISYYDNLVREFNAKYKESSKQAYRTNFAGGYTTTFNDTFHDYLTHPHIGYHIDNVIGEFNAGIIQPGEQVKVTFTAENLGGVGSAMSVSLGGNVVASSSQDFQIERLKKRSYSTNLLGAINPSLGGGSRAEVDLVVNGISVASTAEDIRNQIEMQAPIAHAEVTDGNLNVEVHMSNVSTLVANGVSVELAVNGSQAQVQNMGSIQGQSPATASLRATGIDPMDLITKGVNVTVTIKRGDKAMASQTFTVTSTDPAQDIANYFNKLVNNQGFVPGGEDRDTRRGEVAAMIQSMNDDEITRFKHDGNPWKNSPTDTLPGKLLANKKATLQSVQAIAEYDKLARAIYPSRKNLKPRLLKRLAYQKLVKQLSKDGNL